MVSRLMNVISVVLDAKRIILQRFMGWKSLSVRLAPDEAGKLRRHTAVTSCILEPRVKWEAVLGENASPDRLSIFPWKISATGRTPLSGGRTRKIVSMYFVESRACDIPRDIYAWLSCLGKGLGCCFRV